jgi:tetratricopeptide (TPR) repeat protein
MKKKEAENVQETDPKSKKTMDLKKSPPGSDNRDRSSKPVRIADDPRFSQAVQNYEAGLAALQAHKYDRAKGLFEKVMIGPSPELADRAAVHLSTCVQQLNRDSTTFKTPEERYDYAVSLMNMGDYVGAREIFEELTGKHPKLDFVWYGAAALNCLMGHFPDAIAGLNEAIRLNPANRYQARNDSDFKSLADDPRFTELLYPDTSAEVHPDAPKWHF